MLPLPLLFCCSLSPPHTTFPLLQWHAYWLCCMVVHSPASLCRIVRERGKGNAVEDVEMERMSRWEKSDLCGTACALHPHPAAHDMPARCAVGDDHLTGLLCSALHGCSAWLLCFLPPCSPSPPHDMVVVKRRRRGRGRRGSHVPPEQSAHKCVH